MHELLIAWRGVQVDQAPFILSGDEGVLSNEGLPCLTDNWCDFISDSDFGLPSDSRLHLGLLPIPFVGNLRTASVFLLMLNPGLGPHDYFGEYQVPEYRSALIDNLRQTNGTSFLFLDPRFSWHGGFDYWHTKLCDLINEFSRRSGTTYGRARRFFQAQIAAIELAPYHSYHFVLSDRVLKTLRSVHLARSFVHDKLVPRAQAGNCLLVVTRAVKRWRLPAHLNIVAYSAPEARSAHLTSRSRGGAAMLRFLLRKYERAA